MNYVTHSGKRASRVHGFTLIELMAVIAIISILMYFLFSAIFSLKNRQRQVLTDTRAKVVASAVFAYKIEYGRWPIPAINPSDPILAVGGSWSNDNFLVLNILMSDSPLNPRHIVYWDSTAYTNTPLRDGYDAVYTIDISTVANQVRIYSPNTAGTAMR